MPRYEVRSREIFDIVDTEIDEVVTSSADSGEAEEVRARLERSPVYSAPAPVHEAPQSEPGFSAVEDDEPIDVGRSNVT